MVHIEVTERQEVVNPLLPFGNDPFFRRFFNIPQMPRKFKREMKGLGSGMIMDLPLDEPVRAAKHYRKATAVQIRDAYGKWMRPEDFVQVTEGPNPD